MNDGKLFRSWSCSEIKQIPDRPTELTDKKRLENLVRVSLKNQPATKSSGGFTRPGVSGRMEEAFEAGPQSLMVAVLTVALKDMTQEARDRRTWPAKRMDAAKWFLGYGDDERGISLKMIAEEFELDAEEIRQVVRAQERLDFEIAEMQRKKQMRGRGRAGKVREIEGGFSHGE